MTAIGERLIGRYIRHPASGGTQVANGTALDAGSVQILDSDITQLEVEALRSWVDSPGVGTVAAVGNAADVWSGLDDGTSPGSFVYSYQEIPWDRRTAARFGPFQGIQDRDQLDGSSQPTGVTLLRTIRCKIDLTPSATASAQLYFALTLSSSPVTLSGGDYVAFDTHTVTGTGLHTVTSDLSAIVPVDAARMESWPSRSGGASGTAQTLVIPVWVWFGWKFVGSGNATIHDFSAWETR